MESTSGRQEGLIVLLYPNGDVTEIVADKEPTLEELKEWVGGWIECPGNTAKWGAWHNGQMVCNEEGKLQKLSPNRSATIIGRRMGLAYDDIVVGTVVLLFGKARMT